MSARPWHPPQIRAIPSRLIEAGREWIKDCAWDDLEPEDVDQLTKRHVVRGIDRHYEGGWDQFVLDTTE